MQGLKPANKSDNLPGPGQYSPTSYTQTVNPAYCIGKATRMSRRNSDNPGPGSYNVSPDHSGPKWKVGTERRLSSTFSEFPGPGAYDTISENTMPAFSMTARRPLTSDCSVPGPGAYSPKSLNTNIQYSVGTASRDSAKKFDVPGPASYFIGTPKSRAAVFGSGQRNFVINSEKNPGPGTYEAKNAWDGPKYTVRSRNLIKSTQETPVNSI